MSASVPPAEGAARRTVAQKMGIKPGIRAHLVAAPSPAALALQLPTLVISPELDGQFDYLHLFTTSQICVEDSFPILKGHLTAAGMLWVSWPKAKKLGTESLTADSDQDRVLARHGRKHLLERGRHLVRAEVHPSEAGQDLQQQPRHTASEVTSSDLDRT